MAGAATGTTSGSAVPTTCQAAQKRLRPWGRTETEGPLPGRRSSHPGRQHFRERRREFTLHRDLLRAPLLELLRAGDEVSPERHAIVGAYRDHALGLLAEHLQGAVIVGPATPGPAPAGLQSTGVLVLSRAWQLLGLPVVAVPRREHRPDCRWGCRSLACPVTRCGYSTWA